MTIVDSNQMRYSSIVDAFVAQAKLTPDNSAISDGTTTFSFSELDVLSNCLSLSIIESLDKLKETDERIVGIATDGVDSVISILAILKSRAAYVPLTLGTLNPGRGGFPLERLKFMIQDTGIKSVITSQEHASIFQREGLRIIEPLKKIPDQNCDLIISRPVNDDLAYVMYTSGSTGKPKAVMIEHHSVLHLWQSLQRDLRLSRQILNVSMNAPLGFDPSVQQLTFLLSGHHITVIPDPIRSDGRELLQFIINESIQVLDCTPAQLRLLVQAGLLERPNKLIVILCGGEEIDPATWKLFADQPHPRVYNLYGPTECTVDSTVTPVTGGEPFIGWPLSGMRLVVLDEDHKPTPKMVSGEIAIAGPGVGRGYLNRPQLTNSHFKSIQIGEEMVKVFLTKDLGIEKEDGSFDFLGRIDRQVKMRGYRIELGEIENVLRRHPRVAESAVILINWREVDKKLVAYYTLSSGVVSVDELRAFLKMWVPEYMIPFALIELDKIPLTENGKIDYSSLPEPSKLRPTLSRSIVYASTDKEKVIASIWCDLFQLKEGAIGINDDFFDLGGDSLMAVEMVLSLEQQFNKQIKFNSVVKYSTISELASFIESLCDS